MADRGSHYASSGEENDSLSNSSSSNKFANDGSFMEMFKKKMEEENRKKQSQESRTSPTKVDSKSDSGNPSQKHSNFPSTSSTLSAGQNINKDSSSVPKKSSLLSFVGKRRGPALKTGAVKKNRKEEEDQDSSTKTDAWSQYMAEVKKYKSMSCQDENKTRPLVK